MATPTEATAVITPENEATAKPTATELMQDTTKLAEVKLSKTDEATLKRLKELGLYSDEELSKLEAGMRVAKLQAAESKGERGQREMVTTFSPVAGNVFRARVIEDKSLDEVKNAFGTDLSDTNSKCREVAFKLMLVGLKSGNISKDWIEEQLKTLNTGKERERKAKDAVVGGTAATNGAEAPTASAAADATVEPPADDENPFDTAELDGLAESE